MCHGFIAIISFASSQSNRYWYRSISTCNLAVFLARRSILAATTKSVAGRLFFTHPPPCMTMNFSISWIQYFSSPFNTKISFPANRAEPLLTNDVSVGWNRAITRLVPDEVAEPPRRRFAEGISWSVPLSPPLAPPSCIRSRLACCASCRLSVVSSRSCSTVMASFQSLSRRIGIWAVGKRSVWPNSNSRLSVISLARTSIMKPCFGSSIIASGVFLVENLYWHHGGRFWASYFFRCGLSIFRISANWAKSYPVPTLATLTTAPVSGSKAPTRKTEHWSATWSDPVFRRLDVSAK